VVTARDRRSVRGKIVSNNAVIKNNRIINVFAKDKDLLIQTQKQGFYT
jgi:hypothetical protein